MLLSYKYSKASVQKVMMQCGTSIASPNVEKQCEVCLPCTCSLSTFVSTSRGRIVTERNQPASPLIAAGIVAQDSVVREWREGISHQPLQVGRRFCPWQQLQQ